MCFNSHCTAWTKRKCHLHWIWRNIKWINQLGVLANETQEKRFTIFYSLFLYEIYCITSFRSRAGNTILLHWNFHITDFDLIYNCICMFLLDNKWNLDPSSQTANDIVRNVHWKIHCKFKHSMPRWSVYIYFICYFLLRTFPNQFIRG